MIVVISIALICASAVAVAYIHAAAETERQRSVGRLYDALKRLDAAIDDVRAMGHRVDAAERMVADSSERQRKADGRLSALEMKVNGR